MFLRSILLLSFLVVSFIDPYPACAQVSAFDGKFEWVNPPLGAESFQKIKSLGGTVYEIYTPTYILHSTDNGAHWVRKDRDSLALVLMTRASFVSMTHGWALLDPYAINPSPVIMQTTDAGEHWSECAALPTGMRPRSISFASASTGWIVGDSGIVLKSIDGGTTWKPENKLADIALYNVVAITDHRAVIAINPMGSLSQTSGVFHTSNGGSTWDTLGFVEPAVGLQSLPILTEITFPDSNHGFAFTTSGQIYRSIDGGSSWKRMPSGLTDKLANPPTSEPMMSNALFTDSLHGWTFGLEDQIFYTGDGANSWIVLDTGRKPTSIIDPFTGDTILFRRQQLQQFIHTSGGRLIVVGARGELRISDDSGKTWRKENEPFTRTFMTSIDFVTPETGWVAGGEGEIYLTTDQGATWQRQLTPTKETIRDFIAVSKTNAWASLLNEVLRTTDGGITWIKSEITGFPLDTVDLGGGLKNYYGINSIHFIDAAHGWCVGNRAAVFSTTDGGLTWKQLSSPSGYTLHLKDIYFTDVKHGWTVGVNSGSVFVTEDGGVTWVARSTGDSTIPGNSSFYSYNAIKFVDNLHGTMVGERGRAFSTTNGGNTWTMGQTGIARSLLFNAYTKIERPSDSLVWAAGVGEEGSGGIIARSTDRGLTWTNPYYLLRSGAGVILGMSFPDARHGWFCGSNGYIVRYTAQGLARIGSKMAENISIQVSPNPMTEFFDLTISSKETEQAKIAIISVLGIEISRFPETIIEYGSTTLRISLPENLSSGRYFIQVNTKNGQSILPIVVD